MLSYCLKCRRNTESKKSKFAKTKTGRIMLSSKSSVCDHKMLEFIKQQEGNGSLSSLGTKTPLIKIPFLDHLLF